MKKKAIYIISGTMIIIFALASGLCPLAFAAKAKRHQAKQETVKPEQNDGTTAVPENAGTKEQPGVSEGANDAVKAKEPAKEETAGVPTKDFKDEDFKPQVEEESSVWMFIKMLLILGMFAGGFYYFYRFVTKKAGVGIFGGEAIKVLSIAPLGQNKYLQVVDLAGKVLVIGVSDNAISLISEITEKDQIDRIRILSARTPPTAPGPGGFQDQIMKEIGKFIGRVRSLKRHDRGSKAVVVDDPADIEYLRRQRNRLKDLNGSDNE
jgi:flagellar biogenesis protein FliO